MSPFAANSATSTHYYVDEMLINEIFDGIDRGHSAVILGHLYNGRHFLIQELKKRFNQAGFSHATMRCVKLAKQQQDVREIFEALCEENRNRRSWVLIASEVDALPSTTTRWLLEEIRTHADRGHLKAIVTGQHDLRDLIFGPKSEITNADHYIVQGLSQNLSARFGMEFLKELMLPADPDNPAQAAVWRLSGGNTFLMRAILWATIEHRIRRKEDTYKEATAEEVQSSVDAYSFDASRHLVTNAARTIENDPGCWPRLVGLLRDGVVPVSASVALGGPLTLSGVAIRKGEQLFFASELMQRLVSDWFVPRRIADLYARSGDWEEAFRHYKKISTEPLVRPHDRDDRADVAANIDALAASLDLEAHIGVDAVSKRFADGCRWLLGFPDVVFWKKDESGNMGGSPSNVPIEDFQTAFAALPKNAQSGTLLDLPRPLYYFAVAAMLPSVLPEHPDAVLVGHLDRQEPISHERNRLLKKLLSHFLAAHGHAVSAERGRSRVQVRDKHAEIVNSILAVMSTHVLDVGQVIEHASSELKKLGYREVRFELLDNGIQRSGEGLGNLTRGAEANQARVVAEGIPLREANYAIIPMKDRDGQVIGTLFVERPDGFTISQIEIGDLALFARQLSTAIRYSDWVQLIQSTLDCIPDPVVIFDAQKSIRYANDAAASLFAITAKWRESGEVPVDLVRAIDNALGNMPHFEYVERIADRDYRGDLSSGPINDWRGVFAGGWVHLHDLNDFHGVMNALKVVAEATTFESATERLIEAGHALHHKWVRIYLTDPKDPDLLYSAKGFGFEGQESFNAGAITRRKNCGGLGMRDWMTIEQKRPLLFRYEPREGQPELTPGYSPLGIPLIRVHRNEVESILEKRPGDYWLDFPLIGSNDSVIGMVSLGCDQNLSRQAFEGTGVLSRWLAGVMEAFRLREQLAIEGRRLIEELAERNMATMAHNLNTEFAGFSPILARYRRKELEFPPLAAVNNDFANLYQRAANIALHAKMKLGTVKLDRTPCDLSILVQEVLSTSLLEDNWSMEVLAYPAAIQADQRLLREVFRELVYNAKKAKRSTGADEGTVRLRAVVREDDDNVFVELYDNGPGVPKDYRIRIFEEFFHLYSGTEQDGLGLGLSWAKRVIAAHRGSVEEVGNPSGGACFLIRLPKDSSFQQGVRDD